VHGAVAGTPSCEVTTPVDHLAEDGLAEDGLAPHAIKQNSQGEAQRAGSRYEPCPRQPLKTASDTHPHQFDVPISLTCPSV
jgi:hypothetical protein